MTFDESDVTFVRCSDEEFSKFKLEDGDLLFNTRNSFELVGKSCLYSSRVGGPTVFNNNIMRMRFIQEVHSEFVSFFLCSDVAKDQLEAMKSGTTNVIGIYFKSLKNLIVSIPNEEAQMQLVSQLRDMRGMVRSLTHQYTSQINQLEELRQSILEQAFEGRLTEPVAA